MNGLVADREAIKKSDGAEKQFKVEIDPALQRDVEHAYEQHGANKKTGTTRLFEWFVQADPEFRSLIISRGTDRLAVLWAREVLRNAGELPPGDGASIRRGLPPTPKRGR